MLRWNHNLPSGLKRLRRCALCCAAALGIGGLSAGFAQADDVVFSSNARFRIPYQLDAAEIQRLRATEIQLHVSTDQGKKWRNVDSVPPVAGKFTFEAAQDGEYWFSVRTISEDGRHHPAGALVAGLKVHVDTNLPTLSLEVTESAPGQVGLSWAAADEYLAPDSLELEFREAEADWSPVPFTPAAAGKTSWSVARSGSVSIRGRIQDRAGNEATAESQLNVTVPAAPASPAPSTPARYSRQPIADGAPPASQAGPTEPFAAATPERALPPFDAGSITALPVINPHGSDYSQFVSQRETAPVATPPTGPPNASQPATAEQAKALQAAATPQAAAPNQPQSSVSRPAAGPSAAAAQSQSPRLRRVNTTSFQIAYALEDVGPSGISSVDLFLTEDGGRKWYHYGADADATSPFEVTVPADGSYGFTIRVHSGAGLSQPPPQPGEAAEMTIAVDRQVPQVTLMPLKQGSGAQAGQMLIEWSLSDEQLAERPVALYYAAQPAGPWLPITGWEPDTGRYLWTFAPDVPSQVYVRVEARDAAGNIARADSPSPLLIDLSRPTARILEVDPLPATKPN